MTSTTPIYYAPNGANSPPATSYPKLNSSLRAVFWHLMGHMDEDDAWFDREAAEVLIEIDDMIQDGRDPTVLLGEHEGVAPPLH